MTTPAAETTTRYDSAWSATVAHTTAPDETAPPTPSTPAAAWSGATLRLLWNGLGVFGEQMPADVDAVEAHLSTAASYVPTSPADRLVPGFNLAADTFRADLAAGVPASVAGLTAGATYYLIVVARDRAGNRSVPSAPVAV